MPKSVVAGKPSKSPKAPEKAPKTPKVPNPKPAKETPTKKPKKNAPLKDTPKESKRGGPRKDGLRAPQVRILGVLDTAKAPMSRKQISAKGNVDISSFVEYLGSLNEETRKKNDTRHFPSLLSLGFVKTRTVKDDETEEVKYEITATGKKAYQKANAE